MFKKTLICVALAAASTASLACTTILVGSDASADGSMLIARNADSNALKAQHLKVHPAATNQTGMHSSKAHNGANDFTYPLPKNGMRYTTAPNWQTQLHGATGFNSAGVGISGTESIFAKPEALAIDPYVEDTGITEDDIPDVILPRAKSAKEAAALLGEIVETKGAGEGFGVAFVDKDGIWYIETATGHHWMATKLPADKYFASANQGRFQEYKKDHPDFLGSKNLVEFAAQHGFYDAKKDGAFNFSKAYTRNDGRDRVYNDPRVWQIQNKLTPSLEQKVDEGRTFPVFATPDKKVTVEDMKALLRNHYADGKLAEHDPYTNGLRGEELFRPISVFRTYEGHVMQVRPNLPQEIGNVTYFAMGMPVLSAFVPFYQGMDQFPVAYTKGTNKADSESAYWKFRKVQTLAMEDFGKYAPIVQERYAAYEKSAEEQMKAFEPKYLEMAKKNPAAAKKMIQEFNEKIAQQALDTADALTNELFTLRVEDIQKKVFFSNNKNKD